MQLAWGGNFHKNRGMNFRRWPMNKVRCLLCGIVLVSCCATSIRAQSEAARSLWLNGALLNLPVKNGAPKQTLCVEVAGKPVRTVACEFANGEPDFWVFVDVSPWRGQAAILRGPEPVVAAIECSDEIKTREPVYGENQRPQFHFSSRRGRLNDPNGLLWFAGEYHLFYQLHPYGVKSDSKHWGHAVSRDLLRWEELPLALYADQEGMMFSGSGVVDWKNTSGFQTGSEPPLVLIYTATGPPRTQCLAYSNDRGRTWTKFAGNPVLREVAFNNRDPKVFWHEPTRRWVMVLHCTPQGKKFPAAPDGKTKKSGTFGIFTSPDLKQWTSASRIEGFRECPDLFPLKLDGQTNWIMHGGTGEYRIGDFDGATFVPHTGFQHAPYGNAFYAGQNFSDVPDGRTVQIGWAKMSDAVFAGMPFSQMMNIPCELSLKRTPGGLALAWQPVREIESLRARRHVIQAGVLGTNNLTLPDLQTECFELRADFEVGTATQLELNLRGTAFTFDTAKQALRCGDVSMPLPIVAGRVQLRLLSDRLLVEIFAAEGEYFGAFSLKPNPGASLAPALRARGGTAKIISLEADELRSVWPIPAPGH